MNKDRGLKEINKLIKEADFLYEQYIVNEELEDYSVPILKAAKVCECICEKMAISLGYDVQNGYVIFKEKGTKDKKRKYVISYLIGAKQAKLSAENRKFLRIVCIYKKKAREMENISRGEMYEFFHAYRFFVSGFVLSTDFDNKWKCSTSDKAEIYDYIKKVLDAPDVKEKISSFGKSGGAIASLGMAGAVLGGPLVLPLMLSLAGAVAGATGIGVLKDDKEEGTPPGAAIGSVCGAAAANEALLELGGGPLKVGGLDNSEGEVNNESKCQFIQSNDMSNIDTQSLMEFFKSQMQESTAKIEAVINDSTKEISVKLDNMAQILQGLKDQITLYQTLVQNQIDIAATADEVDRIVHAYSETCVNKIVSEIDKKYSDKARIEEEEKLKTSLGENAWNKLSEESKNYLISAKVTYSYYSNIYSLDYSGVCLLVTKALEVEMSRRFYKDFVAFLKSGYEDSWKNHLDDFPTTLIKTVNGSRALKSAKEFTLGSVSYVLCATPDPKATEAQQEVNRSRLLQYAKQRLFIATISDEEIMDKLRYFGECIDEITKKYRNKAAHTNELKKVDAEGCFEIVIDVEKLLKKILEMFRY